MRKDEADTREEILDAELKTLAEVGDWDGVVQMLDHFDVNNERRHKEHRADMDISVVDCGLDESEYYKSADLLRLSTPDDWLDVIYSRNSEDLYQLVGEYPVSEALRELTMAQKQVLFLNIIHKMPSSEAAAVLDCSVRNITKHRQKALERIRFLVTGELSAQKKAESAL